MKQVTASTALLIRGLLITADNRVTNGAFGMSFQCPYDIPPEGGKAFGDRAVGE